MKKLLSPAFFLLVVGAFFLPFVTISCNTQLGQEFVRGFGEGLGEGLGGAPEPLGVPEKVEGSATGIEVVTGKLDSGEAFGAPEALGGGALGEGVGAAEGAPELNTQPYAIAALVAAALGVILGLLAGRAGAVSAVALGVLGAVSLFLMKTKLDGQIPDQAALFGLEVKYRLGFWAALLLFLAALGAGAMRLVTERPGAEPPAAGGLAPGPEPPPPQG